MRFLKRPSWSARWVWLLIGATLGGLVLPRCEPLLPHPDCPVDASPLSSTTNSHPHPETS